MRLPFNKPDKPVSTKFGLSQPGSCNASLLFRSLPAAFACEVPGASQDQGAPSRRHEDCREVAAQVDLDPRGPVVRPARARRVRRARRARRAAKAVKGQGVGGERKWWEGLKRPHGSTQVQGVRFFHQWVTNDVHLYLFAPKAPGVAPFPTHAPPARSPSASATCCSRSSALCRAAGGLGGPVEHGSWPLGSGASGPSPSASSWDAVRVCIIPKSSRRKCPLHGRGRSVL